MSCWREDRGGADRRTLRSRPRRRGATLRLRSACRGFVRRSGHARNCREQHPGSRQPFARIRGALRYCKRWTGWPMVGLWRASCTASGFEDRPNLVAAMARGRTLLGNTPDTIARVKAPADFAALCRTLGIPHPEIAWKEPRETGWLWKRRGGSGGVHVQTRKPVLAERGGWYLQKRAEGRPVSALFLADGHRSLVLGFSEQWPDPTPAHPFRYGGAVRPATLSARMASRDGGRGRAHSSRDAARRSEQRGLPCAARRVSICWRSILGPARRSTSSVIPICSGFMSRPAAASWPHVRQCSSAQRRLPSCMRPQRSASGLVSSGQIGLRTGSRPANRSREMRRYAR